ncbi:MAG TPA: PD-(D/E)XK nuclease family protein [Bryobacteraceae bacterium]|nr:PD-(D/E)XK nuclease family protein [Bryobacteraceae bacterium]
MDRYTQGTVVTANGRLSRQMHRDYDGERRRQGLDVWESPDILPRGAWLERVWQECAYRDPFDTPVMLSAMQEEALWEQSIAGSVAGSGAAEALLDLPATVSAAAQAWSLVHAWEARCETPEFRGLHDPEAFLGWMQAVERKLREQGWITASQLPRALLDRITAGTVIPGAIFYAGFDELSPADRRLFEACHAQARKAESPIAQPRQFRVGLRDFSEELMQAAAWARRKLQAHPAARIGIVVRGLAGLSAAAERIFDDVFYGRLDFAQGAESAAFHISSGAPSSEVPLIAEALLVLGLVSGLRRAEAGMLLRSPFLRIDKSQASRLYADLRRQGIEKISFEVEAVRRAFPALAKAADELRERQHPSEWSATFSKLLQRSGWPGDRPLTPAEHQTVEHWKNLLSELAALDVVLPRMTYGDALRRLRRIAHERRFGPRDEGAPVQIMDMLEAAGSQFDALWIAGLHGGVWPEAPRPSPFLPLSLQRSAGMPHSSAERELAYARRVTERLLASATEVVCSYPLFSGEEKLRVSPLIEALPEALPKGTEAEVLFESPLRRIFAAVVPLEVQPLGQAPALVPGTLQTGGMGVLADQAACPFRAFARHRLRTREYDPPDIGISPSERGNVAHKALEYFWRDVGSQRELLARPPQEIDAAIESSVNVALDSGLSRRHRNTSLERSRALEHDRLKLLLAEWLQVERTRTDFEVVEREAPHSVDAGGVQLDLKVDRIDRMPSGKYVVLDYKTSDKLKVDDWEGERPDAPQLPLYAVKSGREVEGVFYAKLVPGETKLLGYAGEELAWRAPEWRRVVDQLGTGFLRGDAAVDPKYAGKTCELCDLHSLCRIAEVRSINGAEDEAGE